MATLMLLNRHAPVHETRHAQFGDASFEGYVGPVYSKMGVRQRRVDHARLGGRLVPVEESRLDENVKIQEG